MSDSILKSKGFSGVGHSVEDYLYKAKWGGMKEFVELLKENKLPISPINIAPTVIVKNEQCTGKAAQVMTKNLFGLILQI